MKTTKRSEPSVRRASNGHVKIAKLRLDSIRLDAGIQTRAHIDGGAVAEYAQRMIRGDRFPPVVVFQDDGEFFIADGFHRAKAARRARLKHILAEVRQGGRSDALRFALGANHQHGVRRSNADKRRSVEMAVAAFGNLSDRLLAEMCGVSQPFVGNLRHQLITVINSPPRLGKDGKLRAQPRAGGSAASSWTEGNGDGGSKGQVGSQAFMELADALASVEVLIQKLVNDPDKTAAALAVIGKVRTDLLHLENRLRSREAQ